METQQLAYDDLDGENRAAGYRARLRGKLDQIAADAKQRLAAEGLQIPLFFLLPSTGSSLLQVGTGVDPADAEWSRVCGIVAEIVAAAVGTSRIRCQEMHCAATTDHHEHSEIGPVDWTDAQP